MVVEETSQSSRSEGETLDLDSSIWGSGSGLPFARCDLMAGNSYLNLTGLLYSF